MLTWDPPNFVFSSISLILDFFSKLVNAKFLDGVILEDYTVFSKGFGFSKLSNKNEI